MMRQTGLPLSFVHLISFNVATLNTCLLVVHAFLWSLKTQTYGNIPKGEFPSKLRHLYTQFASEDLTLPLQINDARKYRLRISRLQEQGTHRVGLRLQPVYRRIPVLGGQESRLVLPGRVRGQAVGRSRPGPAVPPILATDNGPLRLPFNASCLCKHLNLYACSRLWLPHRIKKPSVLQHLSVTSKKEYAENCKGHLFCRQGLTINH